MSKLKVAYFGTPDFSARFLENVINAIDLPIEVVLVVTQPDKPVGRKQILTSSPVKEIARKYNLDLYDGSLSDLASSFHPLSSGIDLALLYAYGDIIPSIMLRTPRFGFWNIHPSLLPHYRGASPMAYPLILGDTQTGVSLIQMDEELDHGPIIAQKPHDVLPTDKRSDLEAKLTDLGYDIFRSAILNRAKDLLGDSSTMPQNDKEATYTRRLTKQDGYIPLSILKKGLNNELLTQHELPTIFQDFFSQNPQNTKYKIPDTKQVIYNMFRGLTPWPGIWTKIPADGVEKRLKITDVSLESDKLIIKKVQLEGKMEIPFQEIQRLSIFRDVFDAI